MKRIEGIISFIVLMVVILVKIVLFHYFIYESILISTIFRDPLTFFQFWLPKIAISIFLASFLFIVKNKYWQIPLLLLIDIWIIANILYFRANNLLLSYYSIMLADNVSTVTSSIWMYFNYKSWLFPLITLIYSIVLFFTPKIQRRDYISWIVAICVSVVFTFVNNQSYIQQELILYQDLCHPKVGLMIPVLDDTYEVYHRGINNYIKNHSIILYFPVALHKPYVKGSEMSKSGIDIKLSYSAEKLTEALNGIYHPNDTCRLKPQRNMLFILVESFESWTIGLKDNNNNYYLPYISELVHSNHTFYADKVISQVRDGVSGDGQMIVSTGLLPLQQGSANMLYYDNVYPSYAHLFYNSLLINSDNIFWRSNYAFSSYGYKNIISPTDTTQACFTDIQSFHLAKDKIPELNTPSLSMIITIDSHSPFRKIRRKPEQIGVEFPKDVPEILENYLTSLNHVDSCINDLLTNLDEEYLSNTDIIICGDHTIFKQMMLREFKSFASKHNWSLGEANYIPLIIISPKIENRFYYADECYQMDIYPTIMNLIGQDDCYSWRGFGINLMDADHHQRTYAPERAYHLSDEIIRNNYFAQ